MVVAINPGTASATLPVFVSGGKALTQVTPYVTSATEDLAAHPVITVTSAKLHRHARRSGTVTTFKRATRPRPDLPEPGWIIGESPCVFSHSTPSTLVIGLVVAGCGQGLGVTAGPANCAYGERHLGKRRHG